MDRYLWSFILDKTNNITNIAVILLMTSHINKSVTEPGLSAGTNCT